MVKRNPHVAKLQSGYLFPEIIKRKEAFQKRHPHLSLINLGIGDTTEPLPSSIASSLSSAAQALGTAEGYTGYGPEEGYFALRQAIAKELYQNRLSPHEIFISDGTNCDIGRLQVLFGSKATISVQDPSYPVYVDTSVILGQTMSYDAPSRKYQGISYLPCDPSNDFFPSFSKAKPTDLIYFCSPNNPTGAAATRAQLEELIAFSKLHRSIIIFDTAYSHFIQQSHLPRSIYEIEGADEVAIELGSFSKMAGFTGVRLAWSVVPEKLLFEEGHSIHRDWNRVHSTFFNGASNISQAGGLAILQPDGQKDIQTQIGYYMENAAILLNALQGMSDEVYGGSNAPYLWVRFPKLSSWEVFDLLMEKGRLVTLPGSGFGPAGEGFIRISAFAKRSHIYQAVESLKECFRI